MSIFKQTFPDFVKEELSRRQKGMSDRDFKFIHQTNSKLPWIRLTSGVNYNGSPELAKKYILKGYGIGEDNSPQAGISDRFSAYSTVTPSGVYNRAGIKPMPGITNVKIDSKGAYGSLQEAVISFKAWDVKQLEELEILYMRPGYTVLLEFGWNYVSDNEHYGGIPGYDMFDTYDEKELLDIYEELNGKISASKGTYDALLGYVKNYGWEGNPDGSFDCSTTIISLGEVIESFKINWIPVDPATYESKGKLGLVDVNSKIIESYERGIIPGLLNEIWDHLSNNTDKTGKRILIEDKKYHTVYDTFTFKNLIIGNDKNRGGLSKPLGNNSTIESWISLKSFCDLLNNYVLPKNGDSPILRVTTLDEDKNGETESDNKSLECIASNLSLSTNLGVCLIRNSNWERLDKIVNNKISTEEEKDSTKNQIKRNTSPEYIRVWKRKNLNPLIDYLHDKIRIKVVSGDKLPEGEGFLLNQPIMTLSPPKDLVTPIGELIKKKKNYYLIYDGDLEADIYDITRNLVKNIQNVKINKDLTLTYIIDPSTLYKTDSPSLKTINIPKYFYQTENPSFSLSKTIWNNLKIAFIYKAKLDPESRDNAIIDSFKGDTPSGIFYIKGKPFSFNDLETYVKKTLEAFPLDEYLKNKIEKELPRVTQVVSKEAQSTDSWFSELPEYITTSGSSKILGSISNIYVNINFLYDQCTSKNIASENIQKGDIISLRRMIQGIMKEIQLSLGNINNFDIHVDEKTFTGRIIDINFTGDPDTVAYGINIGNTASIVKKYSFESKIFPEMGSIISISAQGKGTGEFGYDNASLIAWNENLTDRILPSKNSSEKIDEEKFDFLLPFCSKIYNYFKAVKSKLTEDNPNYLYGGLNNAYRDFLSRLEIIEKENRFKTIIPTELSITIDGISGIIIGNIFTINQDIIPVGYKGNSNRRLGYVVTGISHDITNSKWDTTITSLPVVLEESTSDVTIFEKWKDQKYETNDGTSDVLDPDDELVEKVINTEGNYLDKLIIYFEKREGFAPNAYWDCTKYRAGYGSDRIYVGAKTYFEVKQNTKINKDNALKSLKWDIKDRFEPEVINTIGKDNWNKLKDNQKAGIISYAYNAGAGITKSLKGSLDANDYKTTSNRIKNGVSTATNKKTGVKAYIPSLRMRRIEESKIFNGSI